MVNIDFGDGYKLMQADELNIILCKETVVENPKAKNYGNRVVRRMGYYGNLSQALNGYKNAKIMDKKIDCSNTNLLSELLRQIDETIRRCTGNEKERNAGLIKITLDPGAYMPEYAHEQDAGADLRSPVSFGIMAGDSVTVDTGVHVEIPDGYVGMLKSKSGLNVKHSIVSEGVIDAGYTGSIRVKLYNHGVGTYTVCKGDKITQLVIMPVHHATFELVDSLDETERGNNGFGSTGR